jgi:AraC-like DNA-binding protein
MTTKRSSCPSAVPHSSLPFSVDVRTSDLAELSAVMTRLFGHHKVETVNHSLLNATITGRDCGGLLLGKFELGCSINFDVDEARTSWIISHASACEGKVDQEAFSPSDLMMFSPGWYGAINLASPAGLRNTCIPTAMMTEAMSMLLGEVPECDFEFMFRLPSDSRVTQRLSQIIALLHDDVGHTASKNFWLNQSRCQMLLMELLTVWPHSYSHYLDRAVLMPRTLRRACEYIDAHLTDSITVPDIAAAALIGVRTLTKGFIKHFGESPLQYLRNRRLAMVHRDLSGRIGFVTVTDIAHKWGFSNVGLLAKYYRERFGELPGTTLYRRK